MSDPAVVAANPKADRTALAWTLTFVATLTGVRVLGLFLSPIELYPEEAQYWVWSRHLAFGYFSKPPMIAWLIRATTAIGGEGEAWVRLSAPVVNGLTALVLQRAGARLYSGWSGFWAAVLYSLMPGVQLSSAAIATDAPMLLFVSLALWAYLGLLTASQRDEAKRCAAGLGLSLGLGALSKYAALYFVTGLVLHALLDPQARRRWRRPELALAASLFALALAPNLAWNALHGFETVAHTAADADWGETSATAQIAHPVKHLNSGKALNFVVAQFGVFGPIPFAVLITGAALVFSKRTSAGSLARADVALLALAAPPLLIVLGQALITRANANWAAAAYSPGALLTAVWLLRWRRSWTLAGAVASQGLLGVAFFAVAVTPALADRIGLANSLKRARGWAETAQLVDAQVRATISNGALTAIAVDDRFLFNALTYYDRAALRAPGSPPLRMWVREARPHNEAETSAPLTTAQGARVLFVSAVERYRREALADFEATRPLGRWSIRLDARHRRDIFVFLGSDYHRQPRDPRTGLPLVAVDRPAH